MTYARARLWLGMTTVGVLVATSSALLYFDAPGVLFGNVGSEFGDQAAALAAFILTYALVHLIADVLGGLVLPRHYKRLDEPAARVLTRLARGILVHALLLWAIAVALLASGRAFGAGGVIVVSFGVIGVLLACRPLLARAIGHVRRIDRGSGARQSPDPGFTGGIEGVLRPTRVTFPRAWRDTLSDAELERVLQRRRSAIASGSWIRGRVLAIAFTMAGVAVAVLLAGPETLGTAAGAVRLSLWFTLWSFLGLLTLPTLSRAAVSAMDHHAGLDDVAVAALESLDQLGDDEPDRPALIETVFHPVPSVHRRRDAARQPGKGFWDVARTALFLSGGGLGLLGRAVHCNAGRPALWVYLPSA